MPLPRGEAFLLYIRAGEITGRTDGRSACTVNVASGDAAPTREVRTLLTGDALLTLGCRDLTLVSQSGAEITVVPLTFTDDATTRALPPVVFVSGFARAEPGAAALAAHLGAERRDTPCDRSGDQTICRLMIRTILLSALRAWAADERTSAWPPRVDDPFLSGVIAAIDDDPGRDWTIEHLAALSAMSRTVFAARFRRSFGRSPASYVTGVRMRRAKELLDAGTPVSETSRLLGYSSDEGFSRAFRRHTGIAPSVWRSERRALLS